MCGVCKYINIMGQRKGFDSINHEVDMACACIEAPHYTQTLQLKYITYCERIKGVYMHSLVPS